MQILIFLGTTTFLLSLFLTPLIRSAFRKKAADAVPLVGGIPIVLACLLGFAMVLTAGSKESHTVWASRELVPYMLAGALLVCTIGLMDDLKRIEPWHKVVGQLVAGGLAYLAGVRLHAVAGYDVGGWSLPLTLTWILICSTAINLIKDIDGLAVGVGLVATCATFVFALLQNNVVLALAAIPLAGGILGFLPYNFISPTIRLGESGRLLIGFMLGCYSILWGQKSGTVPGLAATLLVLSVPLFDAILVVARRFLRRQPLGATDATHIYHRLLQSGLTPHMVTLVLCVSSAIGAVISVLILHSTSSWMVIFLFYGIAWILIRDLGYVEFGIARRVFTGGILLRQLNAELTLRSYETRLKSASTPEEYWEVVVEGLNDFGFYEAQLSIADSSFEWSCNAAPLGIWEVSLPIGEFDCLRLSRTFGTGADAHGFAPFVDLLRRSLTMKRGMFLSYRHASKAPLAIKAGD